MNSTPVAKKDSVETQDTTARIPGTPEQRDAFDVGNGQPTGSNLHVCPGSQPQKSSDDMLASDGVEALLGPLAARIDALGDKVESKIEGSKFMKAMRKRATNFGYKALDPKASKADAFFQRMIKKAEEIEKANQPSTLEAVAKMLEGHTPQCAVQNLQKTAATIMQWAADAQNDDTGKSHGVNTSLKDIKRAQVAAKIISEFADQLADAIANEDQEKAKQLGVDIALKIRKKGLSLVGRFTHTGRALKRGALTFFARTTKKFFQSIRKTSVNVTMSFGGGSYLLNNHIQASMYFPSLEESANAGSFTDKMYFDYGDGFETLVPYVAWGRRGKTSAGVNIGFFSAFYDDKQYGIWLGWPGVWGISLGKDNERGAYTSYGTSVPIPLCPMLFMFPGGAVKVYSPFLNPLEKLGRPAAKFLVKMVGKATEAIKKLGREARELKDSQKLEPVAPGLKTMADVGFGAT